MKRRTMLGASLAALPLIPAWASEYPKKPIRLINPYPAGSPTDAVARKLAEAIAPLMGQPVYIENKSGANGAIGTMEVVRAQPDGYTLGIAIADSLISVAAILKSPGYDARKDLTLIRKFSKSTSTLFANSQSGILTIEELIKRGKAKPDSISYASYGAGTVPHMIMGTLEKLTGAQFVHVPYKGLAPAMQEILGDVVQLSVGPGAMISQYMAKGQLKPLATLGPERSAFLPQVPTFKERGFDTPFLRNTTWWAGLIAPKNLPPAIIARWNDVITKAISTPEFEKFLATGAGGQHPNYVESEQFTKELIAEWDATIPLIQSLGVVPQ